MAALGFQPARDGGMSSLGSLDPQGCSACGSRMRSQGPELVVKWKEKARGGLV